MCVMGARVGGGGVIYVYEKNPKNNETRRKVD